MPPRPEEPLDALGAFVEARHKLRPGLYVASRVERLAMAEIAKQPRLPELGRRRDPLSSWAPATRRCSRVLLKTAWQHNRRDGGRVQKSDLFAAQVLLW